MEVGQAPIYAFRRNLVLAASAGTGKTHSLVGVLVHVLMGASELGGGDGLHAPIASSRIVATTFSRKAAAEIRGRLVTELERLVNGDAGAKYSADLDAALARVGKRPWSTKEKAERARAALDGLPRAQIGTLHSFASTIARRFALELGMSPGFEMADEDESRTRARAAIERVLTVHATGASAGVVRALAAGAGGIERLIAQLERLLERLDEDGRGAARLVILGDDEAEIDARFRDVIAAVEATTSDPKIGPLARDVVAAFRAGDDAKLASALSLLFGLAKTASKTDAAVHLFSLRDALPRSGDDDNADVAKRLLATHRARARFAPLAREGAALLAQCEEEIQRESVRDCVLGFGQVLRAARDVLRDHPRAARELGAELDVLLVDEFQDTSRLQRDLVVLLWERDRAARAPGALAKLADVRRHGLFVVGDRKQSIYGFRGADVSVFAELCVGLAGAPAREALGIAKGAAWEPEEPIADFVPLRHNRRSTREILTFANAFSARRFRIDEYETPALYEIAYAPKVEDLEPPPRGDISSSTLASTRDVPGTTWLRLAATRGASTRLSEAFAIAHRVRRLVAPHDSARDPRATKPSFRDFAVLAQSNKMLDACAFAFAQAEIPFVVAGSGFYSAREVRDAIAMLSVVVHENDTLSVLTVLRGPWAGVRDETLMALTDPARGLMPLSTWDATDAGRRVLIHDDDRAALARVRELIERLRRNVDRFTPAEILREAVRELSLEEVLIQLPRGTSRVANLRKLIAMASREVSARTFLERMHDAAEREVKETEAATFSEEDDAVRLLTVHASKGLDFPIVFVPEVGATVSGGDPGGLALTLGVGDEPTRLSARVEGAASLGDTPMKLDPPSFTRAVEEQRRRDRAERARLAYVAATRAARELYFVGDRKAPKEDTAAYARTTAAALADIGATEESRRRAMLEIVVDEDATPTFDALPERVQRPAPPRAPPPLAPTWKSLPIATTALADFAHCPRRFQLFYLLDLPEPETGEPIPRAPDAPAPLPKSEIDARAEGTLGHRLLERIDIAYFAGGPLARRELSRLLEREGVSRESAAHGAIVARVARFLEGAYASRIVAERAVVIRERPFLVEVPGPRGEALALRGTVDLLVQWPDGSVDVLDYKRGRGPAGSAYAFQLGAYALAARQMFPEATAVRAGIVFLGGDSKEPVWCALDETPAARAHLTTLASELVSARWTEEFPRVAIDRCHAIRCGYIALCHPILPSSNIDA